jgi:putative colanic acid biosynthesis acetyltransferase WcaF
MPTDNNGAELEGGIQLAQEREDEALPTLDFVASRRARTWTLRELVGRAVWEVTRGPLFAWTPRPLWGWRRVVLRIFGAQIGRDVRIHPTVKIDVPWNLAIGDEAAIGDGAILYSLGMITIGRRATVSQYAHLCAGTHSYEERDLPLLKLPITVADEAWICADAFVGPGVNVGRLAIVGARAVVVKDVADQLIVVGNPAQVIKTRTIPR